METIEITKQSALAAHRDADSKGRKLLETLFGKEFFNQKITDRVKTFEDACEVLGFDPVKFEIDGDFDALTISAYRKLIVVARALNEGWEPDWTNSGEYKYYPYFKASSGSGLSYGDCDHGYSYATVGSRLCFKTSELARYAGTQFIDLYNDYFLIK